MSYKNEVVFFINKSVEPSGKRRAEERERKQQQAQKKKKKKRKKIICRNRDFNEKKNFGLMG